MTQSALSRYTELSLLLNETALQLHPSEAHGLLCGILCGEPEEGVSWEEKLVGNKIQLGKSPLLQDLYTTSQKQLAEFSFDFQLLLPSDEEDLTVRTEALTLWCQGFLTGLNLADVPIKPTKSPKNEVSEAINDLIEITKVNFEDIVSTEEDEEAYVELVEYVRMTVLMIYQELQGNTLPPQEESSSQQLH